MRIWRRIPIRVDQNLAIWRDVFRDLVAVIYLTAKVKGKLRDRGLGSLVLGFWALYLVLCPLYLVPEGRENTRTR